MKRFLGALVVAIVAAGFGVPAGADEPDAKAVLDKAIKALGGEEKLAKAKTLTWKSKGTISIMDNDNPVSMKATAQGLNLYRSEFEGEFNGNNVMGVTVLSKDKGWRKFGDNAMEMDDAAIANEKRTIYLAVVPVTVLPLKGEGFKIVSAAETKVDDKPAVAIKATGPDGKEFTLWFDKESGLPGSS